MTKRGHPGTIEYSDPTPVLVDEILLLLSAGRPRQDVAARIATRRPDRLELNGAHTHWVRRMSRMPWNDPLGPTVLRILETVIRSDS